MKVLRARAPVWIMQNSSNYGFVRIKNPNVKLHFHRLCATRALFGFSFLRRAKSISLAWLTAPTFNIFSTFYSWALENSIAPNCIAINLCGENLVKRWKRSLLTYLHDAASRSTECHALFNDNLLTEIHCATCLLLIVYATHKECIPISAMVSKTMLRIADCSHQKKNHQHNRDPCTRKYWTFKFK